MTRIQQAVLIYKEKTFSTAQNQFEKDLKKRQREGWRLVSITPTKKKVFGRIVQLTAIYEREAIDYSNAPVNNQPLVKANEETIIAEVIESGIKKNAGMWERIKESNKRAIDKENAYQSTLNPEQLRKRKHRNLLISLITLLVVLALCIGVVQAVAHNPDLQTNDNTAFTPQPTDTFIPTPTPINLATRQGVEVYTKQILDNLSPTPYGSREGILYTENTKELQVLFYISSNQVLDNNNLKNMIEINCFDTQKALWTSRLKGIVNSIIIHIQSDLVDKYGNQSKGEVGTATLTSATNSMIQWDNIDFGPAWDNQVYDVQWMLPSIEKS